LHGVSEDGAWAEVVDVEGDPPYYVHLASRTTTWHRPRGLIFLPSSLTLRAALQAAAPSRLAAEAAAEELTAAAAAAAAANDEVEGALLEPHADASAPPSRPSSPSTAVTAVSLRSHAAFPTRTFFTSPELAALAGALGGGDSDDGGGGTAPPPSQPTSPLVSPPPSQPPSPPPERASGKLVITLLRDAATGSDGGGDSSSRSGSGGRGRGEGADAIYATSSKPLTGFVARTLEPSMTGEVDAARSYLAHCFGGVWPPRNVDVFSPAMAVQPSPPSRAAAAVAASAAAATASSSPPRYELLNFVGVSVQPAAVIIEDGSVLPAVHLGGAAALTVDAFARMRLAAATAGGGDLTGPAFPAWRPAPEAPPTDDATGDDDDDRSAAARNAVFAAAIAAGMGGEDRSLAGGDDDGDDDATTAITVTSSLAGWPGASAADPAQASLPPPPPPPATPPPSGALLYRSHYAQPYPDVAHADAGSAVSFSSAYLELLRQAVNLSADLPPPSSPLAASSSSPPPPPPPPRPLQPPAVQLLTPPPSPASMVMADDGVAPETLESMFAASLEEGVARERATLWGALAAAAAAGGAPRAVRPPPVPSVGGGSSGSGGTSVTAPTARAMLAAAATTRPPSPTPNPALATSLAVRDVLARLDALPATPPLPPAAAAAAAGSSPPKSGGSAAANRVPEWVLRKMAAARSPGSPAS